MTIKTCVSVRLRRFGRVWQRHMETIRIREELDSASDRALAEMGVARGDIDAIAHGRYGES